MMFFWDYKGTFVVLTDEEEMSLVRELAGESALDVIDYNTSREARKRHEKKIFKHLKSELLADPDKFSHKYSFRSYYEEEARKMFPILLEAYGRATQMATIGAYGGDPLGDDVVEDVLYARTDDDLYHITLFRQGSWPWAHPQPTGRITFTSASIEKVVGSVDTFLLITTSFNMKFTKSFIRMSVRG
ncbi:hypothetical protein MYX82_12575 [Acidobacteria bacterium AH-259-D05]|nr:hypothetical protein [Acidobacteria bacterium AH-259-D05]